MSVIKICTGRTCSDFGSKHLFDRAEAENQTRSKKINIQPCACLGRCEQAVNIKVERTGKEALILNQITGPKLAQIMKHL
jgi:NADH:ubiquinone oxidoreductase subunit E